MNNPRRFFRGPFTLPKELHERTSAIASTYFELEQSRKAVDAKGKMEIKTCKVCNLNILILKLK